MPSPTVHPKPRPGDDPGLEPDLDGGATVDTNGQTDTEIGEQE